MIPRKMIYILAVPLIGLLIYINQKVDSLSPEPMAKPAASATELPEDEAATAARRLSIETDNAPRSEDEWSKTMDQTLNNPSVTATIDEQLVEDLKSNPQRIREKLMRINDEITEQQLKVRQRPMDEDEEDRLQSLYMLKATITAIGDKIHIDSPADH